MTPRTFIPIQRDALVAADGPLVRIELDGGGRPLSASAAGFIDASPERVWAVVSDFSRYADRVPMIERVTRNGDRVTIRIRFRVAFFTAHFEFTADATREEGRWLALSYVSGEPGALQLRFDIEPDERGCIVHSTIGFDIDSLGWLTKYFLKHHPEIRFGVFPGSALVLFDAMRRAAKE